MNHFTFDGCAKMLNRIQRKNRLTKDEEINYLIQLFNQNEEAIEELMLKRLKELIDKLTVLRE